MVKLIVLLLLMILHASQLASSNNKERDRCAPVCSVCYKNKPSLNCRGTTCSNPGKCKILTRDRCGCCLVCAKLEGESCGGLYGVAGFCASHLRCSVSEKRALAGKISTVGVCKDKHCFRLCTNTKAPQVCGSDGKWHKNECLLKKLNCDTNRTKLEVVNETICEKNCPTSCKDVPYEPVCGSDKKIYSNKCKLKQAACLSNKNITVAPHQVCFNNPIYDPCLNIKCSQGEACVVTVNEKKTDKVAQCQCISATDNCLESIHVCASDNTTYKSHCHMDAEACASRKRLTVAHYGECRFVGSGGGNIPGSPYIPPTTPKPKDPFNDQRNSQS